VAETGTAALPSTPPAPTLGRGVVVLLALAVFINYVDRGNLATAAPLIKDELGLTATQFGLLVSVFFWTYTPAQILAGWLAEKINPYRTLAIGLAVWSVATALTGVATGFAMLIGLRLLLGLGESVAFPCSSKVIAQNLPQHRLGIANGMVAVGLSLGPAFGTFTGGLLMAQLGWRPVFLLFGLGSLLWLWPWLAATRRLSAHDDAPKTDTAPPFRTILARREIWGAGLGHFASNYALYFVISWLPLYLVKARGFSVAQMAELGGLIYLVYAASSIATGWLTDRWMSAGGSANRVRKTFIISSHVISASAMLVCAVGDQRLAVASLFIAGIAFGLNSPNIYAIGQTLAGPRAAGKWIGIQNCMGNTAGIVAPIVTGMVVDATGAFTWAFAVTSAVALTGVVGWGLMIRRVEPIDWAVATSSKSGAEVFAA
jgi:MFS family permease